MYQDGVQHLEQMSTSYIVIPFDFTTPSLTYNTYLKTTLTPKTIIFARYTYHTYSNINMTSHKIGFTPTSKVEYLEPLLPEILNKCG